jgi:hypothetical protein
MLFKKIVGVYFEKISKPINTVCLISEEFLNYKECGMYGYQRPSNP